MDPLKFLEIEKLNLINKLQLYLQQPLDSGIKKPKVVITNTDVLEVNAKSGVSIEFYVVEEQYGKQIVVNSSVVMALLYKLLKIDKVLHFDSISNAPLSTPNLNNNPSRYYLNAKNFINVNFDNYVVDLRQMKCLFNCSDHGYCDMVTYKCVCDTYWIFNLHKYYFLKDSDVTYGNNCGKKCTQEMFKPIFKTKYASFFLFMFRLECYYSNVIVCSVNIQFIFILLHLLIMYSLLLQMLF